MKKLHVFLLFNFLLLFPIISSAQFKELKFRDLREEKSQVFSFIDYPTEIVHYRGYQEFKDTLGETEIFFGQTLLACYSWEPGYMGLPMHIKTNFMWSFADGASILLISQGIKFTEMVIVKNKRIRKFDIDFVRIKKVEVDIKKRVLKITYNNTRDLYRYISDQTTNFIY